jgi:trk system potassium uptake protein TrkH
MNFRSLIYYLGWFNIPLIGLCLLTVFFSFYSGHETGIEAYYTVLIISSIFLFFSIRLQKNIFLRKFDLLMVIFLGWLIFPIIIAIPFYTSPYQVDLFQAYFESFSGFSGYGLSIFTNPEFINEPLLLWRSGSQWIGGFYFLFTIISILSTKDFNFIPSSYISSSINSLNFETKFMENFLNLLYGYLLFSLFILLVLNFSSFNLFEKINLMMTAVSSGGFYIKQKLFIFNNLDKFILAICFLFSTLNIFILYEMFKFSKKYNFKEDFIIIVFSFSLSFLILLSFSQLDSFYNIFLFVSTSISTSGIALNTNIKLPYVFVLIVLTFIGGSVFSTGGGFKLLRIIFFIKKFLIEITKLLSPSITLKKTIFDSSNSIKNSDYYIISLIFISYGLVLIFGCFALSFENISFENTFKIVFLTLNNTLPLNYLANSFVFSDLSYISHFYLLAIMFLSKVYFIAVLVIIKKIIWN